MKKVQEGVWQSVHSSHKYKTNMLMVKFITPYDAHRAAYQNLLARMMEDGSLSIRSRRELEQRLADLYGANLSVSVRRQGRYLEFTLLSSTVREDLLPQATHLVDAWYDLIQDLLFHQRYDEGVMERFEREKQLLIQKYHRQKDDKSYQAIQRLFEHLYREQGTDGFGSKGKLSTLEQATLSNVAEEYRRLVEEAQIHIILHGVIEDATVLKWLENWPIGPRQIQIDYHRNHLGMLSQPYQLWQEVTFGEQTHLVFAYCFQPLVELKEILTAALANALFGALPTSELFISIREQKSLTYDITSSIDFQRHLVLIDAGVANHKGELVAQEIEYALQRLIQTLDEAQLQEAKNVFLSYEIQSQDIQEMELVQLFSKQVLSQFDLSLENYHVLIEQITVQEMIDCLKQWRAVGCYLLKGEA